MTKKEYAAETKRYFHVMQRSAICRINEPIEIEHSGITPFNQTNFFYAEVPRVHFGSTLPHWF
ncbi:MAG: hypothetical protein ACLPX5_10645 [Dissulfurispiraceae bacterium]